VSRSSRRDERPDRIHDGLVGARVLVGTPYLADPELRRQYEAEIAPRTEAALARVFAELGPRPGFRRVLDLGAGTGAAGRAVRAWLGGGVEIVGVDRVPGAAVDVVADLRRPGRPPGVEGRFELIVAAHLLNELGLAADAGAGRVLGWCRELLAEAAADGAPALLVLVEPAPRATSRALLDVRDRLVAAGLHVVAPCLWQGPCPALARPRDFCHASADWEAQRRGRSRVDFSYLVLCARGRPERRAGLFRIVSDPMIEKGRRKLVGCGPAGRHALVRLDRDRSEANRAFEGAARGDVVEIAGAPLAPAGDGLRVGREARVTVRAGDHADVVT
jgi:hypothetical protein